MLCSCYWRQSRLVSGCRRLFVVHSYECLITKVIGFGMFGLRCRVISRVLCTQIIPHKSLKLRLPWPDQGERSTDKVMDTYKLYNNLWMTPLRMLVGFLSEHFIICELFLLDKHYHFFFLKKTYLTTYVLWFHSIFSSVPIIYWDKKYLMSVPMITNADHFQDKNIHRYIQTVTLQICNQWPPWRKSC